MLFEVEVYGYDAEDLAVASVWIDPATLARVGSNTNLTPHGRLMAGVRADGSLMPESDADAARMVGWIEVPDPENATGCAFLQVFLYDEGDGPLSEDSDLDEPPAGSPNARPRLRRLPADLLGQR